MNEADTRAEFIDKQLEHAGWIKGGDVRVHREFHITKGEIKAGGLRAKRLIADYVLGYKGVKLAVVEAKSDEVDVSEGVAQAKNYANKLGLDTSFAANGREIYHICHKSGKEGIVATFPTPQELWDTSFGDASEWQKKFNAVPFAVPAGKRTWYYQEVAVNRACNAIAHNKKRVLLTLATGTGKTFIAFQIVWKLFHSRWNIQRDAKRRPRILFLADRNILADQAYLQFGSFKEDVLARINPQEIAKKGEVPQNANIFFTIFQTFMSGKGDENYFHFKGYEPDFFDMVIVDECHRGGARDESTWRAILNYFDKAVHLGLTATPKRESNVDTYQYFGTPVFTYSLKAGIEDGFLTPFKIKYIQSNIDEYTYTPGDEVLEGEVMEGKVYGESEMNRTMVIKARERKRVQDMLVTINHHEKTIVFCADQAHAVMVRDLINRESASTNSHYCVRVTADEGELGETHLRQFQDNEKTIPTILTTSQKLSTGVDARNIRNIVLLRHINSTIEFKQIIGRGTRLFEGKNYFTILDFVGAYRMFHDPDWEGPPIDPDVGGDDGGETPISSIIDVPNDDDDDGDDGTGGRVQQKTKIRLSDGRVRELKSITISLFMVDGKPCTPREYLIYLFNTVKLPELFGSEEKLRTTWADPRTRLQLLQALEDAGCGKKDLRKLQKLMDAENSDLFDVLEYIAYAEPPISRVERVKTNKSTIYAFLNSAQREFVGFVLRNYIDSGVDELDISRLSTILNAKYDSLHEAEKQLGDHEHIRHVFISFQKSLYKKAG